jgi:hypothetical protein
MKIKNALKTALKYTKYPSHHKKNTPQSALSAANYEAAFNA